MRLTTDDVSPVEVVAATMRLVAVPAVVMWFGSVAGFFVTMPSARLVSACQHLSGGIVMAAVACELVQQLRAFRRPHELLGIAVGFTVGVVLMLSLEYVTSLLGEGEPTAEAPAPDVEDAADPLRRRLLPPATPDSATTSHPNPNLNPDSRAVALQAALAAVAASPQRPLSRPPLQPIHAHPRPGQSSPSSPRSVASGGRPRPMLRRAASIRVQMSNARAAERAALAPAGVPAAVARAPPFPAAFAATVWIDSAMDGLLVGVAVVTGGTTGLIMAIALMVEMGFLGLTFATSLKGQRLWPAVVAFTAGPVIMLLAGVGGALAAHQIAAWPALFAGVLAFATSALLYMVTEELLLEAHADGQDHVWWIDCSFFAGFLGTTLLSIGSEPAPG